MPSRHPVLSVAGCRICRGFPARETLVTPLGLRRLQAEAPGKGARVELVAELGDDRLVVAGENVLDDVDVRVVEERLVDVAVRDEVHGGAAVAGAAGGDAHPP